MPTATANGVGLTGNYKCNDGTPAPDDYDAFQTYYVVGYEVATGSGVACTGPVVIFDGVTSIGESAFEGATGITSLTISNSVTTIGVKAFKNATGITTVYLGNSVTIIEDDAFHNVYGVTTLNIPNSVQTIGEQAFRNLGIADLYIPDSVTEIGDYAFYSSASLARVQIGSGVTTFGAGVFDVTQLFDAYSTDPVTPTVFYCGSNSIVQTSMFDSGNIIPICGDPGSPSLDQVQVLSENSVRLTFTSPLFTGAGVVSQYEVSIRDPITTNVLSTQSFTPSPAIARGASSILTVINLTAGTTYGFSLKSIKLANSEEYGSYQSDFLTATTTASPGGGTGGGGNGADELRRQQEAAAAELRRQQEAAQAAKQKQDQELREILSLVPTIAGLAQGIAGLGNSLLLPKKCVKGKVVKNVKAGAKCPKGYKARK